MRISFFQTKTEFGKHASKFKGSNLRINTYQVTTTRKKRKDVGCAELACQLQMAARGLSTYTSNRKKNNKYKLTLYNQKCPAGNVPQF